MDRDAPAIADVHNHLVPGVDDGARSVSETLAAVERLVRAGIRRIITTPHIDGNLTHDPSRLEPRLSEVDRAFGEAADAVRARFPDVEFARGHEVMLDVPDPDFSDERLRMAGTSFVLVEWPRLHLPPGTPKVLERIRAAGYRPIVAHPERYGGLDLEIAAAWRGVGAHLQVSYGSLLGRYGPAARVMAHRMLRRGMVDYLASDFHARPGGKIYKREAFAHLRALGGHEALVFLSLSNPVRILSDEAPLQVPPIPAERGFWARMKEALNPESA
ncbi:MAG TPA: CpsB/CapC family capsule biosynthesis tyrosine phosphatase [Longimicrobiales bacterium]|nr:CpsB/CapC family capsule biosynthesis tyrosine phosphatase [Longimicrobiales bacterium]